jgi:hypothetical protein
MISALCSAIRGHYVIEFDYDEHHRVLSPHTIYDSQDGQQILEGWQTGVRSIPP